MSAKTFIGCEGCPKRQEYNCFPAMTEKKDIFKYDGLRQVWGEDIVPIKQVFENSDGEAQVTDNQYADPIPMFALCPHAIDESTEKESIAQCLIDTKMEEAIQIMEGRGIYPA